MKKIEFKKDVTVIAPYTIIVIALFVLVGLSKITWTECLGGLALLNVPAIFGLTKKSKSESEPPKADADTIDTPILPPRKPPSFPGSTFALLLAIFSLGNANMACGYGKTACTIIDAVDQNCAWIRYLDESGQQREIQLSRDEITELGRSTAKKRAAERGDGGAP